MSQSGSPITNKNTQTYNQQQQSYLHTYIPIDQNNFNPNTFSNYSINSNTIPSQYNNRALSSNQVSQITGQKVRQGSVIKGRSRIQYVPFEKKVMQYQTRTYKQMIPKTRKVVQYQERKYYQNVPREVTKQQYIVVQKITQYIKQVIPEKKMEMVPVQRKVKKIQYVPVEKQIVHYPKNQQFMNIQGKSRVVLQSQGVQVRPDAQYRPIQSDLLYKFTSTTQNPNIPVGYVDLGSRRYLSTAPTHSSTNLGYQNGNTLSHQDLSSPLGFEFQQSQIYDGSQSFINNLKGGYNNNNNQSSQNQHIPQQQPYINNNNNQYNGNNGDLRNNWSTTRSINEY